VAFQKDRFRSVLIGWYRNHGRNLPWRLTRDPYAILVSEFMLQQTQVATVMPYYRDWVRRFPDFDTLARAPENDVLHAWQGLGYYSRARNLHAAAKIVQHRHGGVFSRDIATIRNLPGIGRYTANAVATFAFGRSVPIVEANTARLLARLFNFRRPIHSTAGREQLWNRAAGLVPKQNAARFNSALMDLGALVCLPHRPKCGICPVKKFCRAKDPITLPVKRARPRLQRLTETHAFAVSQYRILLAQSQSRWRGMWILPRLLSPTKRHRAVHKSEFPFTHHRVTLKVYAPHEATAANGNQRWMDIESLDSIPVPSPHRRAIAELLAKAKSGRN
jgi:A/G-specific adenine glycosylase